MKTRRPLDFKALELKLDKDSINPHTIYFKEHSVRDHTSDKPQGKTLFVLNVPPYVDEKGIAHAFSAAGNVKSIQFTLKPTATDIKIVNKFLPEPEKASFKVCYIVFEKVAQLNKALELKELNPVNSDEYQVKCGVQKWIAEYNNAILQPKVLKEKVEEFMIKYDEECKRAEKKEQELAQEDDDGWLTVTKRGKIKSFARSEKVESKIMDKEERNKNRKELKNFYTFQIRESKMKHVVALRQKFEEDKKKIAHIKQNRRFKPF